MDTPESKWIERAVKAETQAKFLYEALQKIKGLRGFDKAYYIAEAASAGIPNQNQTIMNRELKFRAWCRLGKKGTLIYFNLDERIRFDFDIFDETPVVQQFIGLKDKNKKDMYEGDIVRFHYRDEGEFYGVVGMDDMYVGFSVQESKAFPGSINLTYYNGEDFSVVGNIFETPKLLQ